MKLDSKYAMTVDTVLFLPHKVVLIEYLVASALTVYGHVPAKLSSAVFFCSVVKRMMLCQKLWKPSSICLKILMWL